MSLWLFASISLMFLPWPDPIKPGKGVDTLWLTLNIAWLVAGIAASILMYKAIAAFQRGVSGEVWDEADLAPVRRGLSHRSVSVALGAFTVCAFGYLLFDIVTRNFGARPHGSSIGGFAYFWLSPLTTVTMLRQALRPKRDRLLGVWRDEMKPIMSEHWGERGTSQL